MLTKERNPSSTCEAMALFVKSYYRISLHCSAHHLYCSMCLTFSLVFSPPMAISWTRLKLKPNFTLSLFSNYGTFLKITGEKEELQLLYNLTNGICILKIDRDTGKTKSAIPHFSPTYLLSVSHDSMHHNTNTCHRFEFSKLNLWLLRAKWHN